MVKRPGNVEERSWEEDWVEDLEEEGRKCWYKKLVGSRVNTFDG